jgi:hypothetical protein
VIVWSFYTLIIGACYSGLLTAFMTKPTFTSPINTLSEVLESKLPWGMVLYGEEEETMMAKSTDPVIQRIWSKKNVEEYAPIPNVNVHIYDNHICLCIKSIFADC